MDKWLVIYTKLTCSVLILWLGPLIGFNITAYVIFEGESNYSNPPFEGPNLCLTFVFFLFSIILLAVPKNVIILGLWQISYFVFIIGHWIVYRNYEKNKNTPASKSDVVFPYSIITIISLFLIVPFIGHTIQLGLTPHKRSSTQVPEDSTESREDTEEIDSDEDLLQKIKSCP